MAAPGNEPDEIADAAGLFGAERPAAAHSPASAAPPSAPEDAYAVLGVDEPDTELSPPVPLPIPARPGPWPGPKPAPEVTRRPFRLDEDEPPVEQVWSRWAEWGPTLGRLAVATVGLGFLVRVVLGLGLPMLGVLLLLASLGVLLLLAYPIAITLERPVRVTPEQAVKDFYGALSHHVPHYRRMWLLLGRAGRTSGSFGSFEGFRAYWIATLARLKGGRAGPWTPLQFDLLDFKAEKSDDATRAQARYTVQATLRGQRSEGPIATAHFAVALVRGPDRMWYLEEGTWADVG